MTFSVCKLQPCTQHRAGFQFLFITITVSCLWGSLYLVGLLYVCDAEFHAHSNHQTNWLTFETLDLFMVAYIKN